MQNETGEELVLFYNVENFYLPDPEPAHRLDPTKSGLYGWNSKKYSVKLRRIAQTLSLVKEEYGVRPFLIGLAEIQGPEVLIDLLEQPAFSGYRFVHHKSSDHRGMDVALLFDTSKIRIISSESISFVPDGDPVDGTRDILYCRIAYAESIFNVFVVHLPSRRDHDCKHLLREKIAEELHARLSLLLENSGEPVVVMGDFNSNPDEEIMQQITGGGHSPEILANPFKDLFKNKTFSTFHLKNGLLFDQILFSEHFFKDCSAFTFKNANVFKPDRLKHESRNSAGRPFRTYAGSRYIGGCSDHFPVIASFGVGTQI